MDNHFHDNDGNPAGGISTGTGYTIAWQNGPLGQRGADDNETAHPGRNGAFIIEVLQSCRTRLAHYQTGGFECEENARALCALDEALKDLEDRRQRRGAAGTLGTHVKEGATT